MQSSTIRFQVPRKLKPLLYPKRYKGAHGGRGGAKSHFFAERAIERCLVKQSRIVCIREVQATIKDSVKQLLSDKINSFGLQSQFDVLDTEIRGPNDSLIIFKGMQSYNAQNIKSLEAYDTAWVEEAQTLSQQSLDLLRPTIRQEGSELWFSWNPRYKTDPVDKFFRKNPHPDSVCVEVNWRDNPWFPEVLRAEMEHDFAEDPDKAEHIWNGAYGHSQGSILGKWVTRAEREKRVGDYPYDPEGGPVEISSDLGYRDTAAWWYWQRFAGGFRLFKYQGASGMDADDWIPHLQKTLKDLNVPKKALNRIWLPHDARVKTFQSKHSTIEKFIAGFGESKVAIVPQSKKLDQISAARTVIDRCEFDAEGCEEGLDGLRAWEFEWNDDLNVFSRDPLHNWASHPADAFAYGAQAMQEHDVKQPEDKPNRDVMGIPTGIALPPLNDLWRDVRPTQARY